ncbi:MAG: hypothetical protein HRU20_17605 [Pseudomonadales bacterium]|nr:hypothetical protein [Pseudomonadales bacterium]
MFVNAPQKQQGSVLIVTMIIMFTLMILSLSGAQKALMQEKMTNSERNSHLAFQAAESALHEAEKALVNGISDSLFVSSGSQGYFSAGKAPIDIFADTSWQDNKVQEATVQVQCQGCDNGLLAKYYIEKLDIKKDLTTSNANTINVLDDRYIPIEGGGTYTIYKVVAKGYGRGGEEAAETRYLVSYIYANG